MIVALSKPMTGDARREGSDMRSDTQTVTIHARPEAVLGFVGDAENLPRWAVGFAKAVARDGDRWIVRTGADDEVGLAIERTARSSATPLPPPSASGPAGPERSCAGS